MAGIRNRITRRIFLGGAASAAVFTLADWLNGDALAQTVRVRPALETQAGQRMLRLYARGVEIMRGSTRPAHDPLSWTFQANIHDYPANTNLETIFRGRRTNAAIQRHYDLAMGGGGRPGIWRTCSHFHNENPDYIHFLSWHRMYLYFFERAIERLVREPFAMPYWNYTVPGQRRIPVAFRNERVGGRPNPLWFRARNADFVRDGLPADAVRTSTAFSEGRFHHPRRGFNRQLELRPHNIVHGAVGTPDGMGDTPMAARDPLFWVHHAAVDRFWETWRQARPDGTSERDPRTPASWLAKQFAFADPDGNRVEMSVADVLRASSRLNYRYDTLEPLPAAGGIAFAAERNTGEAAPTQLSTGKGGAVLTRKDEKATLEFQPSVPSGVALGFSENPATYYELVVDVEVNAPPGALYEVYIAVPRSPGGTETEDVKVDTFSLFGVGHGGGHAAHSPAPIKEQWRADITGLVGQGRIDPQKPGKVSVKVIYADPASEVRITGVGIEAE
jgi:tyrosinase